MSNHDRLTKCNNVTSGSKRLFLEYRINIKYEGQLRNQGQNVLQNIFFLHISKPEKMLYIILQKYQILQNFLYFNK